jgi:hypothetical protein
MHISKTNSVRPQVQVTYLNAPLALLALEVSNTRDELLLATTLGCFIRQKTYLQTSSLNTASE